MNARLKLVGPCAAGVATLAASGCDGLSGDSSRFEVIPLPQVVASESLEERNTNWWVRLDNQTGAMKVCRSFTFDTGQIYSRCDSPSIEDN